MKTNELIIYTPLILCTFSAFFACWKFSIYLIKKNDPEAAKKWSLIAAHADTDGSYNRSEIRDIKRSHYMPYLKSACSWNIVFIISAMGAYAFAARL